MIDMNSLTSEGIYPNLENNPMWRVVDKC